MPRLPIFLVTSVEIVGNQQVATSYIEKIVKEELEGYEYIFFPRRNYFWLSVKKIENSILGSTTRIHQVEVNRDGFQKINIDVKERSPYVQVCSEMSSSTSCYLVDADSVIYANSPNFTSSVHLKFILASTSSPLKVGDKFLDPSELKSFVGINEKFKKINLEGERVDIMIDQSLIRIKNNGYIIVNKEQNMDIAFDNLRSLIESKEFKGKRDGKIHFEYIDLRFGNKLFYKI